MRTSLEISQSGRQLESAELHSQRNSHTNASSNCSDSMRWAKNTGVVMMRNAVSVLGPTVVREGLRRTVFKSLAETHPELMAGLSLGFGLLPVALQLTGLGKEYFNGTQTRETVLSRLGLIGLTGGCVGAAAVSGRMLAVAPAILSANIYTVLRDSAQHFIRLKDTNAPESSQRCGTYTSSSVAYMANQLLVGVGMDAWTDSLTPDLKEAGANVLARSLLNFAGETVDELFYQQSQHWFSSGEDKGPLDLTFGDRKPITWKEVTNTVLTSAAGRSALFSSAFNAAYTPSDDTWKQFSKTDAMWASNAIAAGVLGVGYSAFVGSHMHKENSDGEDAATVGGLENQISPSPVEHEAGEYVVLTTPHSSSKIAMNSTTATGDNIFPNVYPAEERRSSSSEISPEQQASTAKQ